MQKSVAFLYTNNELAKEEIKKTIPLIIASKRIKYPKSTEARRQKTYTLKIIKH